MAISDMRVLRYTDIVSLDNGVETKHDDVNLVRRYGSGTYANLFNHLDLPRTATLKYTSKVERCSDDPVQDGADLPFYDPSLRA